MTIQQNILPLKDLNLTHRFLFDEVMEDFQTHQALLDEELVQFLHYLENTTDVMAANTDSDKIKRIHSRVCRVKASEKVGVKYMQAWEEKYFELEEAANYLHKYSKSIR